MEFPGEAIIPAPETSAQLPVPEVGVLADNDAVASHTTWLFPAKATVGGAPMVRLAPLLEPVTAGLEETTLMR